MKTAVLEYTLVIIVKLLEKVNMKENRQMELVLICY